MLKTGFLTLLLVAGRCEAVLAQPQIIADAEPLSPEKSAAMFEIPDDLEWQQALSEPLVQQPIFLNFDERGRMWVAEYLQYPYPAGLKILSRDEFYRTVFDKVPPPPPNHFKGADRIAIYEDTDGDGKYDSKKAFVEGLNIMTSFARGRGGVWVLNPPYLLFYPDKDNDDVPDGDPEVHLSGFGIQDTHSVTNSLRFGPDGWLYATQGSTVTAKVVQPGQKGPGVFSMGQLVWRYHPERKIYEIFAEGGGNAFGVEIDAKGRIFSGHNGGDTRGFHYVQGGYYQKGFTKHGPLSNPFAFGYFPAMKHAPVPRFTHNFVIYEGNNLPEQYQGKLFGIEPLQGRLVLSEVTPDGSSYQARDLSRPVTTSDHWFRPVDIKEGPDGAIYVADMYERYIAHRDHYENRIHRDSGRIYRLQKKGSPVYKPEDLSKKTSAELVGLLSHPNKWHRQTALRLLGDRKDQGLHETLLSYLRENKPGQQSLEYLWALNLSGGLTDDVVVELLTHPEPQVRAWTVRLMGDNPELYADALSFLSDIARNEKELQVRSQFACTARRLEPACCLELVDRLLRNQSASNDVDDIHIPLLLWWAIEKHMDQNAADVVNLFKLPKLLEYPMVHKHLLSRIMRRLAQSGKSDDLTLAAKLLQKFPSPEVTAILLKGFEEAFQGRSLGKLPPELVRELDRSGLASLSLSLRQGKPEAVAKALDIIQNEKAPKKDRLEYLQILSEIETDWNAEPLYDLMKNTPDSDIRQQTLAALRNAENARTPAAIIALFPQCSAEEQRVALTVLGTRPDWTSQLLAAVKANAVDPKAVPEDLVRQMTIHRDPAIQQQIKDLWGSVEGATSEEMQAQIEKLMPLVQDGKASPYEGKKLFQKSCAKCHVMYGEGGRIGPDLTSFKRDDHRNMLINIVNPSVEIREGFESFTILTVEGRAFTGFILDRGNQVITLRSNDGQTISIPQSDVEEILPQKKSLMPEGLLKDLTDQQIRDLFAWLRTSQPLNN